mmetsp:Transcript_909/g.1955  ORF Transcript_909/g.1955 Transcript_909/m.1955 type:complete len:92 (+) Transcript_909:2805-3080(+)
MDANDEKGGSGTNFLVFAMVSTTWCVLLGIGNGLNAPQVAPTNVNVMNDVATSASHQLILLDGSGMAGCDFWPGRYLHLWIYPFCMENFEG